MRIKLMRLAALSLFMIAIPVFAAELTLLNDTKGTLQLTGRTSIDPSVPPLFTTEPFGNEQPYMIEFDYPSSGTLDLNITKIAIRKSPNEDFTVYSNNTDGICSLELSKKMTNPTIIIEMITDSETGKAIPECVLKDEVVRSPSAG